jgi:hypothetical protein
MIAHLFGKVYLNFDVSFKPAFNTLIVSKNRYAVHDSFINTHVGLGVNCGSHESASSVDWTEFFTNAPDTRTVVYADELNLPTIYFSFLKTVNPGISQDNATKILEIVLKRARFYINEYDAFGAANGVEQNQKIAAMLIDIRTNYDKAWALSKPFGLSAEYIQANLGLEFLLAQYWADGRNEALVKERLVDIWWKIFVQYGEEATQNYSWRWIHQNPGTNLDVFLATMSQTPGREWMADPNLDLEKTTEFRNSHDWSTVEAIYNWILSDQDNGNIIEMHVPWTTVVDQDWTAILDKSNPRAVIVLGTEPVYRMNINTWLISYFATKSTTTLGEMVL